MTFEPLEVVSNKFYFGIGGLGDFLLLMSTFYDDFANEPSDVIFVCNNVNTIREMSTLFPKVNKFWFYPRKAFSIEAFQWYEIIHAEKCLGTGVTPKEFDYITDWIECGKTSVFNYYGVDKHPAWASPKMLGNHICIQAYGGSDDLTKSKLISDDEIVRLYDQYYKETDIVFIGSEKDKRIVRKLLLENNYTALSPIFPDTIKESFDLITQCVRFYGCDSWGKTVAAMASVPTWIYRNQYTFPIEDIFGHKKDPGDYVFLDNWGFFYHEE